MALGIENLKRAVKLGLDFSSKIQLALADGKFVWTELFNFVPEFLQLPGVTKSWKEIVAEVKELDALERQELYAYVVENFSIPNAKVEAFVENSLLQVVSLVALVEQWKDLRKPKVV